MAEMNLRTGEITYGASMSTLSTEDVLPEDCQEDNVMYDSLDERMPEPEAVATVACSSDGPNAFEKVTFVPNNKLKPDKQSYEEVRRRTYLYGITEEGKPVACRYIRRPELCAFSIKRTKEGILRDFPNVVEIYMVDNSKDIHEAFNRANDSKYRPMEDRAIFRMMLMDTGVILYSISKEA